MCLHAVPDVFHFTLTVPGQSTTFLSPLRPQMLMPFFYLKPEVLDIKGIEGRDANSIMTSAARNPRSWVPLVTGVLSAAPFTGERMANQPYSSSPGCVVLTKNMGGCVWFACKDCAILCKRLRHLRNVLSEETSWTQPRLRSNRVFICMEEKEQEGDVFSRFGA